VNSSVTEAAAATMSDRIVLVTIAALSCGFGKLVSQDI
jgi:hypothetical protein